MQSYEYGTTSLVVKVKLRVYCQVSHLGKHKQQLEEPVLIHKQVVITPSAGIICVNSNKQHYKQQFVMDYK